MQYSPNMLGNSITELTNRIETVLQSWDVEQEAIVRNAIAKITPFEFEIIMQWAPYRNFAVSTSGSGPADYERIVAQAHGGDARYMQDVFRRHCDAIGRLQRSGLLGLNTHADPPNISFSYYWTDLGNLVLLKFRLIDQTERQNRFNTMPPHLRRVT